MYGWIVDGISSLFEPVTGKGNVSEEVPTRPGVEARAQESHSRPAKRNYQSVDVADGVCQSDQVEAKRRRRDVVISFVKKTVAGVANLLRLKNPLTTKCEKPGHYEDRQPVTLMGIDELHTSWLNSTEWRMSKPVAGVNDRSGKNPFQNSSPPLMRKYSGAGLSAGLPDRERRGSLQLLPSRPALRVGTTNPDLSCNGFGHHRCFKPSLTVEEAIKQNNKEHYRRLLEMVSEKYSKSQPLPFNQTKPQDESLSQVDYKTAASGKAFESVSRKTGYTASPSVFTWRNASAPKDRWGSLTFSKTFSGFLEDTQPVRCAKQKQAEDLDLSTEVATRLNLVDRETPAVSLPDTHSAHTRHSDEDIPRLTKEMAAEVSSALAQSDPNLVLSAAFKLRITQRDLATLQEGGWLNDEVINFYLSLVVERGSGEAAAAAGLKIYSFSTFFFPKLRGGGGGQAGGHTAVKRWTKAVDLFLYDLILVPLHLGVHWAMAVIDFKSKTVRSYDSMGQRHEDVCSLLLLYLREEHKAKKGRELDSPKWTVGSLRPACHMPLFRKLMIWEILNQKLQ
ncbi:sentrin-specific protease 2 isoform X2 [Anarhichas minor]|uniref:sentrin-specific protease 2 isoform X2 n=1 Tax=Anarhichas minor TaxID=65739 RepID=UPI003F7416E8